MTKPETADEGFDSSVCSSAFTYDEVVSLVKRKKALWLKRLHQVDSDSRDDFQALSGYVAACNFIIRDLAAIASDKQKKRLANNGPSGAKPETM
jgi:hypothetical protein